MAQKHTVSGGESQQAKRIRLDTAEIEDPNYENDQISDKDLDEEFEADPDEALQEALAIQLANQEANQERQEGSIREAGSISKVVLWNFMCHRFQEVQLGPQANFIIGNNGSGKSAVLTAITLVLGAKAKATNRAASLSTFIKEGESRAEITLHLTNRGDEAFKPEVYGDEIVIQRIILKESGSYKIKSGRDSKIISTKKETLQNILDHFMIQADNPLNVLNQDAAKKFLNASTSKEKYELFIRGTQLQQLTDEYEEINANLVLSRSLLEKKRQDLPVLHNIAKGATQVLKEVKEASQAQEKITQLKRELAWVYVTEGEEAQAAASETVADEERLLEKIEESISETKQKITKVSGEIKEIENEKSSRNDEALESKRLDFVGQLRTAANRIKSLNTEIREANATIKKLDEQISTQQKDIDTENAKSLRNTGSSRQQAIDRVEELTIEIETTQNRLVEIQQNMSQTTEAAKDAGIRGKKLDGDLGRLKQDITRLGSTIQQAENAQKNRLHAYDNAQKLKDYIDMEQSWTEKPIGPLGIHIQLKEKSWAPVLETVLGSTLNSYVVTNRNDEQKLRGLMRRCGCSPPIIRTTRDMFDYSRGEPDPQHLTILRALDFDDEFVKRAFINDARIERCILVPHRRAGEPIMTGRRHNIDVCYTLDGFRVSGTSTGSKGVTPLTLYKRAPRISADHGAFIEERRKEKQELESSREQLERELSALRRDADQLNAANKNYRAEEQKLKGRLRHAQDSKSSIEDEIRQNASSNVAALEDMKKELEEERKVAMRQIEELLRQREQLTSEIVPIRAEKDAIQLKLDNRRQEDEAISQRLTEKVTEHVRLNSGLNHYGNSLAKQKQKISAAKSLLQEKTNELGSIISQAKRLSDSDVPISTTRSKKKLISELESLSKVVKSTENRHGNSLEQIEAECHDASANFFKAEKLMREQGQSLKMLKTALALRKERWLQFRIHIAARAKMTFVNHLRKRGFVGKLNFNHQNQRLEIQVNINEADKTQGKAKETKGLSGGEKSFSTISLLLTLWDAINCPIRCLDEFDVFMDDVNRRVSLKMMIESSIESNEVQYIFITPNSLGTTHLGPNTKIVRMADPEREKQQN